MWTGFEGSDESGRYSYATDFENISYPNVLFNIHFWVLLEDQDESDMDNYNYVGPTEYDVLTAIANANKGMNKFGIFFKYDGVDVVNDSSLALVINPSTSNSNCLQSDYPNHTPYGTVGSTIVNTPEIYPTDALNVYIMKESVCFGGWGPSHLLLISDDGLEGPSFVHEMGHFLGLGHTRGGNGNSQTPNNCEHVTRDTTLLKDPNDPFAPYFNADKRGDRVVDTPAVPDMYPNVAPYNYNENCEYIGDAGDCQGSQYDFTSDDLKNTMGDGYYFDCTEIRLTPGQGIRMREKITSANPNTVLGKIRSYDMSPLYEPYKGQYFSVGPDLPYSERPLFQPGFNYKFVECNGDYPQPSNYYDTSFWSNYNNIVLGIGLDETNYSIITHPNHTAIRIKQVQASAHKCYDNNNRMAIGGKVTKFHDNVINTNLTETNKDATAINDQNLIQDLETGLYKIDKNFEDGSTEEVIIFKENN